jgi:hypothetical protein
VKRAISILLSVCLGLFVVSGALSVVDDSLQLFFGRYFLSFFSGTLSFLAILATLLVYLLMGFFPMIPKRVFVPIALLYLLGFLGMFPVAIYTGDNWMRSCLVLDWIISICQVVLGLGILYWLWGGWKFRWLLVEDKHLGENRFSWRHLIVFALINVFVLLPVIGIYFFSCTALAVDHFTAGFLALHPGSLEARVKQYVRSDGKRIELVPMAHVADADFYYRISTSFPTNSIVLMEGVTDEQNLLPHGISYQRMARSLGLAEQQKVFKPRGTVIRADVDVDQFTTNTIALLNLAMLIHTKGINAETMMAWAQYSPPPDFLTQLDDDIVRKRNKHLLKQLQAELPESDIIIIPWGAGHMPGIASAIEKDGFHLDRTDEYTVIRFRP